MERLVLKVTGRTNIGEFAVFRTGHANDEVNIDVSDTYWFPNKEVDVGDLVVLYTKAGEFREKELKAGGKAHFYYWDRPAAVWADADVAAVVLHAPEWEGKIASDL